MNRGKNLVVWVLPPTALLLASVWWIVNSKSTTNPSQAAAIPDSAKAVLSPSDLGGAHFQEGNAASPKIEPILDRGLNNGIAANPGEATDLLADICGDLETIEGSIQIAVRGAASSDLTEAQWAAADQLSAACASWEEAILEDDSLAERALSVRERGNQIKRILTSGGQWSQEKRDVAFDALKSSESSHAALAAIFLMQYDHEFQTLLANSIGTTDTGYIAQASLDVGALLLCRINGDCSKDGITSLNLCLTQNVFCDGIENELMTNRTPGQYEDTLVITDRILSVPRDS